MEARHLITTGIALLLVAYTHGSGYLEVHLHSLANPHGRKSTGASCDWHERGCDHQFDFCLTTENNDATCHYGKKTTSTYENTYGITFGSTINGGLANPFTFSFPISYPGAFRLIIAVSDDDHPFTDDAIDTIVIQRRMSPGESERDTFNGQYIGDFRMDITVTVQCDPNFYGNSCNRTCVPRDDRQGHYTCNSYGQKVCNKGWIDPFYSCTTPVCNTPCVQGTCTEPNICSCNSGYTGPQCDQVLPPDEVHSYPLPKPGTVRVTWTVAPNSTHGLTLTGYSVQYREEGGDMYESQQVTEVPSPGELETFELEGLELGTTYELRIAVVTLSGVGKYSDVINVTTYADCCSECSSIQSTMFVSFEVAMMKVDESDSLVHIDVFRYGPMSDPIILKVTDIPVTAKRVEDYSLQSSSLVFLNTERMVERSTVVVRIREDSIAEQDPPTESFRLVLSSSVAGGGMQPAVVFSVPEMEVHIRDNDY